MYQLMDPAAMIGGFVGGMGLSLMYFGMLWMTVRSLPDVENPALFIIVSFFVRMTLVLSGFYLVMAGDWRRLALCVVGFVLMRKIVLYSLKTSEAEENQG